MRSSTQWWPKSRLSPTQLRHYWGQSQWQQKKTSTPMQVVTRSVATVEVAAAAAVTVAAATAGVIRSSSHTTWAGNVSPMAIILLVPTTPVQPASKNSKATKTALLPPITWTAAHAGRELGKSGPPSKTTYAAKENLPRIDKDRGWMT